MSLDAEKTKSRISVIKKMPINTDPALKNSQHTMHFEMQCNFF